MNKKIIFMIIVFMSLMFSSFAALETNNFAYYNFDNESLSGSNPTDESGNQPDGINNGVTTGIAGIIGEQFDYPGVASKNVSLGRISDMEGLSKFSLSAWITLDALGNTEAIFAKGDFSTYTNTFEVFTFSNKIYVETKSAANRCNIPIGGSGIIAGSPFHLLIEYDGTQTGNSNRLKVYVNNNLATCTYSGTIESTTLDHQGDFYIGERVGAIQFNGLIDELGMWDRILTTQEKTDLYNKTPLWQVEVQGLDITNIDNYQGIQRDNEYNSTINITGTRSGNVSDIGIRFDGGQWTNYTIDINETAWRIEHTLPVGQGLLEVRSNNNYTISDNRSYVTVGDVFVISGQSNHVAFGQNLQTSNTTSSYVPIVYRAGDDTWQINNDPIAYYYGAIRGTGSPFPLLSNKFLEQYPDLPIIFIQATIGGTAIDTWVKGGSSYDAMIPQLNSASLGKNKFKGYLFFQGESDAYTILSTTYNEYKTNATSMVTNLENDLDIEYIFIGQTGSIYNGQSTDNQIDIIREAQRDLWSFSNIYPGLPMYDVPASDGGLHYYTDDELQAMADRWFYIINQTIYKDISARQPLLEGAYTIKNEPNKIRLDFDTNELEISEWDGTSGTESWGITVTNGIVDYGAGAITSTILNDDDLIVTFSSAVNETFNLTIGSGNELYDKPTLRSSNYGKLPMQTEYNIPIQRVLTPYIQTNVTDYYKQSNITIYLNTSQPVNMSYVLDGAPEVFLGQNLEEYSLELNSISEGNHSLKLISRDENEPGEVTTNETFIVDTLDPTINISTLIEWNDQYNVTMLNETMNIECNDSNLKSCLIYWDDSTITNVTNENYKLFTTNGYHNFSFVGEDFAGNNATINGQVFINPEFFVYFIDTNSTPIYGFNINQSATLYGNYFNGTFYDYGLGTHNFVFEKYGYTTTTFQLTFNETNQVNATFQIPGAQIVLYIYDITDYELVSGINSTVEIIGISYSNTFTTDSGLLNISSIAMLDETYSIIISNEDYETTATSFNFDNQESITVNSYMTPLITNVTEVADVIISVVDEYQTPQKQIDVFQYVWDSGQSQYVQSNLKETDNDGQTSFKVFLNTKRYNFCAEYDDVLYCEYDVFINVNTDEIPIEIPVTEMQVFNETSIYSINFSYSLTNQTINITGTNYTAVTFTYNNPNQNVDEYCLKIFELVNLERVLTYETCSESHTQALNINVLENRTKNYVAVATIEANDQIRELDEVLLYAEYTLQEGIEQTGLWKLIILLLVSLAIGIPMHKKVHKVELSHIMLPGLFFILSIFLPDYVSFESVLIVAIMNYIAIRTITKKDDTGKDIKIKTLIIVVGMYILFIFSTFTVLTEMSEKELIDDRGEEVLNQLSIDNTEYNEFIETSSQNLKDKRSNANTGAWELLTGIFLKTIEFLDVFFTIMSNIFSIATNISVMIGVTNPLAILFLSVVDWVIIGFIIKIYYNEAFK